MKYRCISADPPWQERGGGKSKRGADRHYPLMPTVDIVDAMADALGMSQQVDYFGDLADWTHGPRSIVADSAHLWLRVTDNFLQDGLRVMDALGFRYVRTLVWVKLGVTEADHYQGPDLLMLKQSDADDGVTYIYDYLQIGLGQYLRGAHELALLGVRGDACLPPTDKRHPSVVFAPRGRHSAKPDAAIKVFEDTSPGPRLEMFARTARPGWSNWGNEVTP